MWGGLIAGPVLAAIAAFSPAKKTNNANVEIQNTIMNQTDPKP
jgi:hypothetical protein